MKTYELLVFTFNYEFLIQKAMKRFEIKEYQFGELAQMYYPDRSSRDALRRFRGELLQTAALYSALLALGYKGNERVLSRSQVRTIVQYLGEP